jgi:hypothetical protein
VGHQEAGLKLAGAHLPHPAPGAIEARRQNETRLNLHDE